MPAITSGLLFLFAAPGTTPVFAKAFGWLSVLGVTLQLALPCTPPWYERQYGLEPAHYGMPGSPAGLARVDALLGVDMYTTSFTTAPVPFGAFPSLHAADATLEALFLSYCFPRFRAVFIGYVGWIWWATMYLNHHYAIDLVAGSLLAAVFYYVARSRWLPRRQLDKTSRWDYEYVEFGERPKTYDEEIGYGYTSEFGLGLLEQPSGDSDEWTVGSTSSFSSHLGSGSRSSTSGSLSPTTADEYADMEAGARRSDELHEVVVR
jgi:inositol phosphorylceramide synthase catalytic subunit